MNCSTESICKGCLSNHAIQPGESDPVKMEHDFSGGIYTRTLRAVAGCVMVGKTHKTANCFSVVKGLVRVWDNFNGVRELAAGHMEIGQAGMRRIAYAHEDSILKNFVITDETSVEKLEEILTEPFDLKAFNGAENMKLLGLE